jgi:hypothetical protein
MRRLLFAALLVGLTGAAAAQTTVYVSPTGTDPANCAVSTNCRSTGTACRTIQCAIDSTVGGETIRVAPGTYNECVTAFFVDGGSGAPVPADLTIVAEDYEVNRRSNTTILDATGLDCFVDIGGQIVSLPVVELGDRAVLRGFTVKGNQGGGGVRGYGAVQITNNVIEGNSALRGGGVYVYTGYYVTDVDGQTAVKQNVIQNNSAALGGGVMVRGIAFYGAGGTVTVESNTIASNTAEGVDGGYGGGLYVLTDSYDPADVSRVRITKNLIEGNNATLGTSGGVAYGGGLYVSTYGYPASGSEVIDVDDNVIRNNFAEGYGGGVIAQVLGTTGPASNDDPGYEIRVRNNSLTANVADGGGGGVYVYAQHADLDSTAKTTLAVEGNAIAGNSHTGVIQSPFVPGGGGGVYAEVIQARNLTPNVDIEFENNTIQTNTTAAVGGGASLYVLADSQPDGGASLATDARVRFENNLVTTNTAATPGLTGEGGGVYTLLESRGLATATATLEFNTVAANSVDPGGAGLYVDAFTYPDTSLNLGSTATEVSNSILYVNEDLEFETGFVGGTDQRSLTVRYNDVYDVADSLYGPNVGNRTGQSGNRSFDPELSAFYVPLLCSASIDAGDPLEGTRDSVGRLTSEPQPNGGIVNLGHLGNTPNAPRTFPDVSGDGIVDGVDVLRIASSFASISSQPTRFNPAADRDRDGDVDGDDLSYVAAFYGQACP